jgi:hypothetical protein
MKESIFEILLGVQTGRESCESATERIMTIIGRIDEFNIDCTKLDMASQIRLRMMLQEGDVTIKPVIN